MHIHIHHHYPTEELLKTIIHKLNSIQMTQEELAQALTDLQAQTDKAKTEVVEKIAALETAIAEAGNTTPAVDAALAALKTSVQGVDDVVPDAPPAEPVV